jgi:hypothetical protein
MPGTGYTLLVDGCPAAELVLPRESVPAATRVVEIHPGAAQVPLNLLKVYVRFSAPMSEGWAARAVRICDDGGTPLEGAFLADTQELWDPDRRRLTLLLDPGRIKRGLRPHDEAGYPLSQGSSIEVVVDSAFLDADGLPLAGPASRRYEVGPPVRERVDPGSWTIEPPAAGSVEPLAVRFDRPLDRALLEHGISVLGGGPARVSGRGDPGPGEESWRFAPARPWDAGRYVLRVEARLEDLAGNSVRRVFDRDLDRREDDPLDIGHAEVAFDVA